jgi:nucleotide-binding universal stress UspA family protein
MAHAMGLARAAGTRLILLSSDPPALSRRRKAIKLHGGGPRSAPKTAIALHDLERAASDFGVQLERRHARGDLATAILAEVDAYGVGMLVVPFHAHDCPGGAFDRSAAERLVQTAPVPVVMVPSAYRGTRIAGPIRRFLIPLDGSPLDELALAHAASLARSVDSKLILVQVVPPPKGAARYSLTYASMMRNAVHRCLQLIADQLRADGLDVQTATASGFIGPELAALAHQNRADLIIMTMRPSRSITRLILGSHAIRTLQHATVPVMILGPAAIVRLRSEGDSRARPAQLSGYQRTGGACGDEGSALR